MSLENIGFGVWGSLGFNDNFKHRKGHKAHTYVLIDISLVDEHVYFAKIEKSSFV